MTCLGLPSSAAKTRLGGTIPARLHRNAQEFAVLRQNPLELAALRWHSPEFAGIR
jgi:hypothetical protein